MASEGTAPQGGEEAGKGPAARARPTTPAGSGAAWGAIVHGDSDPGQTQPSDLWAGPWWWGRSEVKLGNGASRPGTGSRSGSVAHGLVRAGLRGSGSSSSSRATAPEPHLKSRSHREGLDSGWGLPTAQCCLEAFPQLLTADWFFFF